MRPTGWITEDGVAITTDSYGDTCLVLRDGDDALHIGDINGLVDALMAANEWLGLGLPESIQSLTMAAYTEAREDKWQPIETARRDGTLVIVGAYMPWHGWRSDFVYWHDGRKMWWNAHGLQYTPTHWMPEPDPPKP